jgi:15-cis-phytoene synthase
MIQLFHKSSETCSKTITRLYSTSFYSAIKLLHRDLRQPVYNIYGFVRLADEIVDTFHDYDKQQLLSDFKKETYAAIDRKLSLNPILHSFQATINQYSIDIKLVDAFFHSMELDLSRNQYDDAGYAEYIYGSAEVVGLMCLYVFCEGDQQLYQSLKPSAQALGAAFQKVNFLRDIRADFEGLQRVYFPGCDFNHFTEADKQKIEADIEKDFEAAYNGILRLPSKARFGVYVAYTYYGSLFKRIKKIAPSGILQRRVRIPDTTKLLILLRARLKSQLGVL